MTFILLIVLAVGQSFAYESSPCPMDMDEMMTMHHDMDMPEDCCDDNCECPQVVFNSVTLLNSSMSVSVNAKSQNITEFDSPYLSAFLSQVYKPPIYTTTI